MMLAHPKPATDPLSIAIGSTTEALFSLIVARDRSRLGRSNANWERDNAVDHLRDAVGVLGFDLVEREDLQGSR